MKARPILFSSPMVQALLAGRKTQTRRIVPADLSDILQFYGNNSEEVSIRWGRAIDDFDTEGAPQWLAYSEDYPEEGVTEIGDGYGHSGDLLWVRETTEADEQTHDTIALSRYVADGESVLYSGCADPEFNGSVAHWDYHQDTRPSIHMPRWASRLTLRITDVRVERLQEISEADAKAEGAKCMDIATGKEDILGCCGSYRAHYQYIWESINGPGSWDANPWVWCVSFDVIHANVDVVLKEVS